MKKEKIILLFIILLIILLVAIIGLLITTVNMEEKQNIAANEPDIDIKIQEQLDRVTDRNSFYAVQDCVEKFYIYYSEVFDEKYEGYLINTEEDKKEIKAERAKKVYMMLDEEYLEAEQITIENLSSKLPEIKHTSILIKDMYYKEKNTSMSIYFIFGTRSGTINSETTDFSMMIKMDYYNRTFKVTLGEQVENYYNKLQQGENIEIKQNEIKNDIYNGFSYEHISENQYLKDLLLHYKKALRTNKKDSYTLLDENYKTKCFENVEEYLSYIDTNYSKIALTKVNEYSANKTSNYTEYFFKVNDETGLIFKETAPFKYTVMLDNYTIPTIHFTEEYKKSSDVEKLIINIEKFFKGINDKNYGYSYSVLAESFKNNKYPTKNKFINYVKENFFESNEIEYETYQKENGIYSYKIKVKDATGQNQNEKTLNMILRLKDGTDFEMSFGE